MRVLSAVQNGVYDDDPHSDVDPDILMHCYGIDEVPGSINHHISENEEEDDESEEEVGDGEDEDEDNPSELEFDDQGDSTSVLNTDSNLPDVLPANIVEEMQTHIRHPPVKVPRHSNPFIGRPEREQAFISILNSPNVMTR
jgi:hypothetical protein